MFGNASGLFKRDLVYAELENPLVFLACRRKKTTVCLVAVNLVAVRYGGQLKR